MEEPTLNIYVSINQKKLNHDRTRINVTRNKTTKLENKHNNKIQDCNNKQSVSKVERNT